MFFFIISLILFIATLIGFIILLALWTYTDAKVRTDKPGIWTLIVLLTPNFMGILIYLLVGRNKEKSPGKYKKMIIVFAVSFILSAVMLVCGFVGIMTADSSNLPIWNGVSIGLYESYWDSEWTISFKTSGKEIKKTVNLSGDDLDDFYVTGNCESGKLYLKISQGETVKVLDISEQFNEKIDMSEFDGGKIGFEIYNEDAKKAKVSVSWK